MSKWYINEGPDSDVVLSSRVRLARNFEKYPFPHKTTPEQQKQIIVDTKDALFKGNQQMEETFNYYDFGTLSAIEKSVFVEKHVASKELFEGKRERGILLSNDERISIMINEEDHLRIQCLATGMQLSETWEVCNNLDDLLSETIEFSWDEDIGYLTSCATNIGTAIRVSVMMHLPALIMTGYMKSVIEALGKLGIAVRGMYGENTEASGNMFQMSNQITLGKSEEDILHSIKNITMQIIEQERALRQQLLQQNKYQVEDRVFRSSGILKNSRIITANECLKHLSNLRLGVDLGIIEDINIEDINELMLLVQPGSLQKKAKKTLNSNERDIVRAEIVRNMMNKQKKAKD